MTNLAAAVELVAKWRKEGKDLAKKSDAAITREFQYEFRGKSQTNFKCADQLETILAELGRGAGGEVAATLIHSPDELTRVDISMHGMGLGYGKHDLFTRPPVAGLAELTREQWGKLYEAIASTNLSDEAIFTAAREFLGKH